MKIIKIIPILFGISILMGLNFKIGIPELINSINSINKYYLAVSALLLLIAMLIKSLRWYYILKPLGVNSSKIAFGSYFIGQATNEILPTGSGELARLTILKKYANRSFAYFSSSVVLERLYDMLLLLILSIFLAYTTESSLILLILVPIMGFVVMVFIKPKFIDVPVKVCKFFESKNILSRVNSIISDKFLEIQHGLRSYQNNTRLLFITFMLTAISWIFFETLSHYLLLLGCGIRIPYMSLLGIVAISWILGTISMLPGGLGAREAVYSFMLAKFGVPIGTGMAVAMIYRGIVYVLFGSLAAIYLVMSEKE